MSTIGSVVLKLEAQHAGITEGLGKGRRAIVEFKSAEEGFGHRLKEGLEIGAGIELARAGIGLVAEAMHRGVEAAVEWVGSAMRGADATLKQSQALRLHAETLTGLQAAGRKYGVENDQMTMALEKVSAKIGEAAMKGGPAAESFERLGLSARHLAGLPLDKALSEISDRLASIKNPAEAAAAASDLFGERLGAKLMPVLGRGSAAILEFISHAEETGVAMNDFDTAKLAGAQRVFDEMAEKVEGVKNRLAVALAPALGEIGTRILALLPAAGRMQEVFNSALLGVARGVGAVIDTYYTLKGAVLFVASGIVGAIGDVIGIVKTLADGIVWVANKLGAGVQTPKFIASSMAAVNKWSEDLHRSAEGAWNQPSAVKKAEQFFASIQQKADASAKVLAAHKDDIAPIAQGIEDHKKDIDKSLADMAREIGTFGLKPGQKKLFDLEQMGADPEQLKLAQQYSDELDRLEKKKADIAAAKSITDAVANESPLQKYAAEIEKLNRLHEAGLLSAQVYAAGVAKANQDIGKAMKALDPGDKHAAAVTRRFDFKGPAKEPAHADPIAQLAAIQKKQAGDVAESKFYLREIYRFQMNADNNADQTVDFMD